MGMVNCDWIGKKYSDGKVALEDIKICIEQGEKVGLVGPMGAGKTTLLRLLAGVLNATSGTLQIGVEKNEIAYMPASKGLIRALTVREHIKMWANAFGARKEYIDYIIETLKLEKILAKEIRHLSSGMQTLVSFGCTVLGKPKLVLLDEPFVHLDMNSCLKIEEIIQTFLSDSSIVISSHDLERMEELSDTLLVIDSGKQIFCNETKKLKEIYGNEFFKIHFEEKVSKQVQSNLQVQYGGNFIDSSTVYFSKKRISVDLAKNLLLKEGCKIKEVQVSCSELKDIYLNIICGEE